MICINYKAWKDVGIAGATLASLNLFGLVLTAVVILFSFNSFEFQTNLTKYIVVSATIAATVPSVLAVIGAFFMLIQFSQNPDNPAIPHYNTIPYYVPTTIILCSVFSLLSVAYCASAHQHKDERYNEPPIHQSVNNYRTLP